MVSDEARPEQAIEEGYGRLAPSQAVKRLVSQVGVYGFGNALQRVGTFVLLPVYIARLSPEEYGVLTLASLVPFALPAVLTLGLSHAITRYYHEWVRSGVAAGNLGMVWSVAVGCMFLATLILDLGGGLILDQVITQAPYQPYLRLAMWWAFFSGLSLCPLCLLRVREESVTFVSVSTGGFILATGLNIWAVLAGQGGSWGAVDAGPVQCGGGYCFDCMVSSARIVCCSSSLLSAGHSIQCASRPIISFGGDWPSCR